MDTVTGTTRLAPSPTGALHLGNLRTFAINWALARQHNWRVILRIEDLDGPRVKLDSIAATMELLAWLGFRWDEGPYFQSQDLTPYRQALVQLAQSGTIYPCRCTRKQILEASMSAPHEDGGEPRYPGTCRPAADTVYSPAQLLDLARGRSSWPSSTLDPAVCEHSVTPFQDLLDCGWRFRVPDRPITVRDQLAGEHTFHVSRQVGDFLVASKGGLPSYQLAVVVDDARQGVDRIVRGDDLLSSVPRQQLLYDALQLTPYPQYWHVPLVRGADGRRLAKRHGDTRIATFREKGVSPGRLIALIARWCGQPGTEPEISLAEFANRFDVTRVPSTAIPFTESDEAWLLGRPSI